MADDLKIALGSRFTKKIDKSRKKLFDSDEFDDDDMESERYPKISIAKQISIVKEQQNELGTQEIVNIFKDLNTAINLSLGNVQKTIGSAMGAIEPKIRNNVLEIIREFKTGTVDEQLTALNKLEKLQKKFNIDLTLFNEKFGKNIKGLGDALNNLKQIEDDRKQKIKDEKNNLKERGIITKIEGEGSKQKLKILTNQQIKEEDAKIRSQERKIQEQEQGFQKRLKEFKKGKFEIKGKETSEEAQMRISKELIESEQSIQKQKLMLSERKESVGFEQRPESGIRRAVRVGGEFLRGERGPTMVRAGMGSLYASATAPIEAVKQLAGTLDTALFDLPSTFAKKLTPKLMDLGKTFTSGFKSFIPNLMKLGKTFTGGFSKMISASGKGLKGLGSLILLGLTKLAAALGLNKIGGAIKGMVGNVGSSIGKVGGAIGKGISGVGRAAVGLGGKALAVGGGLGGKALAVGGGLLKGGLGLLASPFLLKAGLAAAAIGGTAFLGKKIYDKIKEKKEENKLKSEDELQAESDSFNEMQGEMAPSDATGEIPSQMASSDTIIPGQMAPIEASLRRKRERDSDMPLPGEFAQLSKQRAMTEDEETPTPSIVNAVGPTNVSNTKSETYVPLDVLNRDPTFLNLNIRTI